MTEENHDNHDDHIDRAQAHLASLKRDMRKTLEDAVVRAAHKVMAEFEAKSDERLMEDWGPGPHEVHSLPAREPDQPAQEPKRWAVFCGSCRKEWSVSYPHPGKSICADCDDKLAERKPFAWADTDDVCADTAFRWVEIGDHKTPVYTSPPPQRKPLTHEQRVDLLAKFEAHKHEWHAPAILIDMVEAAHGIKGDA